MNKRKSWAISHFILSPIVQTFQGGKLIPCSKRNLGQVPCLLDYLWIINLSAAQLTTHNVRSLLCSIQGTNILNLSQSHSTPPPTFLAQPASSQVSEVGDFLSFPALLSFLLTAISDSYRSGGQKRRENKDFVDYYGCKIPALTATIESIP